MKEEDTADVAAESIDRGVGVYQCPEFMHLGLRFLALVCVVDTGSKSFLGFKMMAGKLNVEKWYDDPTLYVLINSLSGARRCSSDGAQC